MSKNEIVEIFNCMIRGTPVSVTEKLIPLISYYLTEINCENIREIITLISQMPDLIQQAMPKVIDYFERKYTICSVVFNNKILMYYVTN